MVKPVRWHLLPRDAATAGGVPTRGETDPPVDPRIPPWGTRENERLEFKASEVLRSLAGRRKLMEEVVGMLNARGGRILIGVREQDSIAAALDPIAEVERNLYDHSMRDLLVDAIEPRVTDQDCRVRWLHALDGFVLELDVRLPQEERRPFCRLSGKDRRYLVRVGDRLRPMKYAELRETFLRTVR